MIFESPGPILFTLGPLTIRWYGVMIAIGFLAAAYAASKLAARWGLNPEKVVNCTLITFIAGILGARLYFAALDWDYFSTHPLEILATWKGGLSIHGGMVGGILAGIWYCRKLNIPVLVCADIIGICAALGQAIGRWGNFFNSEAFGKPVPIDFPLKLFIPYENRPEGYQNAEFFHPTFLYESLWDLTIFALLYFFAAEHLRKYPGASLLVYLSLYSIGRLLVESLRTDSIMAYGLKVPMIASIVLLVICLAGLGFVFKQKIFAQPQKKSL